MNGDGKTDEPCMTIKKTILKHKTMLIFCYVSSIRQLKIDKIG